MVGYLAVIWHWFPRGARTANVMRCVRPSFAFTDSFVLFISRVP